MSPQQQNATEVAKKSWQTILLLHPFTQKIQQSIIVSGAFGKRFKRIWPGPAQAFAGYRRPLLDVPPVWLGKRVERGNCSLAMEYNLGTSWNILEHLGTSWNILEHLGTIKQMTSNDDKFHRDFGKAPVLCTFVDQLAMEMADELFHDFAVYVNKHQQRECYKTLHNCFLKQKQKVG